MAEWQAAQTLDPADAETARSLGSAWVREGNVRAAHAQFQRAVDARPEVALYHFDLANVLFLFRHSLLESPGRPNENAVLREALAHFHQAAELAPANLEYAEAYADTFYGLPEPDWTAALAAWQRVRALSGPATDFPDSHLARVSLRMGKPGQAETYLEQIHDPQFAPIKTKLLQQAAQMKKTAAPPAP